MATPNPKTTKHRQKNTFDFLAGINYVKNNISSHIYPLHGKSSTVSCRIHGKSLSSCFTQIFTQRFPYEKKHRISRSVEQLFRRFHHGIFQRGAWPSSECTEQMAQLTLIPGWRFGTFFIFHILERIIPININ